MKELGIIPVSLERAQLGEFLKTYAPKCPMEGCHQRIRGIVEVERRGKYGQHYALLRLIHHDRRKNCSGYCYLPVGDGKDEGRMLQGSGGLRGVVQDSWRKGDSS